MAIEKLGTSQKSEKLPANISVVESVSTHSLFDIQEAFCESGSVEFLNSLSASVGGSEVAFFCLPPDEESNTRGSVSLSFTFAKRDYVPRLIERKPWKVWYKCEAKVVQNSNEVALSLTQVSSEKGESNNCYSSTTWKDGEWKDLGGIEKRATSLVNAIEPKTGIDRRLYDSFNGDLIAADEISENSQVRFKKLTDMILGNPIYRPIVERHLAFHLNKDKK